MQFEALADWTDDWRYRALDALPADNWRYKALARLDPLFARFEQDI